MKKVRLTKEERAIEGALGRGEYFPGSPAEFERIAQAIARRKKDAVLTIRVNREDLQSIRQRAKHFGVPYQTFISEVLHRLAA